MRKNNSSRKNRLLALLLSAFMASSLTALTACSGDDSSSSSSSPSSSATQETEKTDALITNGDFNKVTDNKNGKLFTTSVSSWTRAANSASTGTAQTSKASSGVIDTSKDAWDSMTKSFLDGVDAAKLTEAQAKSKWNTMSLVDKLAYYEAWEDDDDNDKRSFSELGLENAEFTIDSEDLPTDIKDKNPLTHDYSAENLPEDYESRVLMIHNEYSTTSYPKQGTAQKYTSQSTVTVAAGTAVQLSLWVKTTDLMCSTSDGQEGGQKAVDKGAYIRLTHSVGGNELDPLIIKNINTENMTGLEDTNGWAQYTFYLRGSSFADTTFTLVLGLGEGGGDDMLDYVNGYAFFDDIECETITSKNFVTYTAGLKDNGYLFTLADTDNKTVKATAQKTYAMDFYGSEFSDTDYITAKDETTQESYWKYSYTTESNKLGEKYTAVSTSGTGINKTGTTYPNLGIDGKGDIVTAYASIDDLKKEAEQKTTTGEFVNRKLNAVYTNYLKDNKLFGTGDIALTNKAVFLMMSANGAAITAENDNVIEMKKGEYLAFSFFVKTSAMNGKAGATITLNELKENNRISTSTLSNIDTTTTLTVDVGDEKDIYDGWQQCFFFISAERDCTLAFDFNFGPTTVIGTTKDAYQAGFAAFAGFKSHEMSEQEFECAASGTYAKIVTIAEDETENNDSFDSVAAVSSPEKNIETGYGNPKNYKGVTSLSKPVGGPFEMTDKEYPTAGLLNQKYAETYDENGIMDKLVKAFPAETQPTTAQDKWEQVFGGGLLGTANQPLVIYNPYLPSEWETVPFATKSYGFVGATQTIAANTYAAVSLRVKASAGAKAYIYLIDTDDTSLKNTLSVSGKLTYWYDDDGNVCASDPTDKNFDDTAIAFKRQSNGLYLVNKAWKDATGANVEDDVYYANLQAYGKPVNGNLMVGKGGNSYEYNDKFQHEGNDGIAYYNYDELTMTAFADKAKTVTVKDFSLVDQLTPRYEAVEKKSMYFVVDGTETNSEWTNVTFYIQTGENAKNYRLEVWSGARDGYLGDNIVENNTVNPRYSCVIFDSRSVGTVDETIFNDNLALRKEQVAEENYFESVFTFYDSAKYLRYNKEIDYNEVGDSYTTYVQSANTAGIAYLLYESAETNTYEAYVNYALSEFAVTPDPEEDTEEDEPEDTTTESDVNPWLLGSSITISAVLILAVISLIVRKAWTVARKKRHQQASKK